jgi:UDP-N-acetylmuramoylalanine--D-glutamate ligase
MRKRHAPRCRAPNGDPVEIDLSGFAGVVVSPGVPLNTHPIAARLREAGMSP